MRRRFVQRRRRARGGPLRRRGNVRGGDAAVVQPLRLRHDELQDQLRDERGLRDGVQLHRQRVHAAAERFDVYERRPVHVGLLRAGRLLQRRLPRHLPELQSDGKDGDVHPDSRRYGAARGHAMHGHGIHVVRDRR